MFCFTAVLMLEYRLEITALMDSKLQPLNSVSLRKIRLMHIVAADAKFGYTMTIGLLPSAKWQLSLITHL